MVNMHTYLKEISGNLTARLNERETGKAQSIQFTWDEIFRYLVLFLYSESDGIKIRSVRTETNDIIVNYARKFTFDAA